VFKAEKEKRLVLDDRPPTEKPYCWSRNLLFCGVFEPFAAKTGEAASASLRL